MNEWFGGGSNFGSSDSRFSKGLTATIPQVARQATEPPIGVVFFATGHGPIYMWGAESEMQSMLPSVGDAEHTPLHLSILRLPRDA